MRTDSLQRMTPSPHNAESPFSPPYLLNLHQSSPSSRSCDGTTDTGSTLPRVQARLLAANNLGRLRDDLLAFGKDELDVAGVGHVGVDLVFVS
jgi:hypothetical protein